MTATAAATLDETYLYELVPLLPLPEVDLSISVKSRFIRSRRIHRLIRAVASSPLTYLGFITYLGISIAVFYVSARTGRTLGIIGLLLGLPGALIPIGNLRFEIVAVLLKTYDMWFSAAVSTVVSVVLGTLLNDVRAVLMLLSWVAFMINICVDASMLGLRRIWIANIFSAVCYLTTAAAVSAEITDGLNTFQLVRINGHELPAGAVVRDCLVTMIIVIGRNVVRKFNHALNEGTAATTSTLFRCVSFRCRLQLRAAVEQTPQHDRSQIQHSSEASRVDSSKTKLRYKPDLELLDVRDTLVRSRGSWRTCDEDMPRTRKPLPWIGLAGFVVTNVVYTMNVAWPHRWHQHMQLPIILLATSASTVFVGITIAAMQRQLLRAVATSFDFLFILTEITVVQVALADILGWHLITVLALFSDLQWCVWILCWDAITPPVRRRLGLSRHFAAGIGFSLLVVLGVVAVIVLIVKPPNAIQDRVIYRFEVFNHAVEFRSLSWYVSCVATISTWALRVIWRLSTASGNELVVLDGTVVYEITRRPERGVGKRRRQRVTQAPAGTTMPNSPQTAVFAVAPSPR